MLQPLLMVKQTMEVGYDPGPLLLSGPNVTFSSASEMFWKGDSGPGMVPEFSVAFRDTDGEYNELTFCQAAHGVDLRQMKFRRDSDSPMVTLDSKNKISDEAAHAATIPELVHNLLKRSDVAWEVERDRCFFEIVVTSKGSRFPGGVGPYPTLRFRATNMLHVPGLRDNPARFYPATQVGEAFPGVFQSYVASIIQSWSDTKDSRLSELGKQLQEMGLTWKVATQRIDDTRVVLRVGRLPRSRRGGSRDLVNIADVGLGVSQILPALVALLTATPGDWVYIEQPEIHLHARAQVALADLLVRKAIEGVYIICETHSYLLLRAIQEAAVRLQIREEGIGLNWFSRDEYGATRVSSVYLTGNGSFGDWPNDFADIEMDIEDRYVQAVIAAEKEKR
jgi:hypothetical protein